MSKMHVRITTGTFAGLTGVVKHIPTRYEGYYSIALDEPIERSDGTPRITTVFQKSSNFTIERVDTPEVTSLVAIDYLSKHVQDNDEYMEVVKYDDVLCFYNVFENSGADDYIQLDLEEVKSLRTFIDEWIRYKESTLSQ